MFISFWVLFIAACAEPETPAYTDSSLYIFGDSLSDVGNARIATAGLVPDKNYYDGRFSNGLNYADFLARKLNTSMKPSRSYGSNYAFAGVTSVAVSAQVFNYQENVDEIADPEAIYIVWAGGNDLLAMLQQSDSELSVDDAIAHLENAITKLASMGATKIVVPNQVDMSYLPRIINLELIFSGIASQASTLTDQFNTALAEMLTRLENDNSISTIYVDVNMLFSEVIANPEDYALNNVNNACYVKDESKVELTGSETICENSSEYLFWDSIHPTTVAHSLIADKIYQEIEN